MNGNKKIKGYIQLQADGEVLEINIRRELGQEVFSPKDLEVFYGIDVRKKINEIQKIYNDKENIISIKQLENFMRKHIELYLLRQKQLGEFYKEIFMHPSYDEACNKFTSNMLVMTYVEAI